MALSPRVHRAAAHAPSPAAGASHISAVCLLVPSEDRVLHGHSLWLGMCDQARYLWDHDVLCCVVGLTQSAGDREEARQPTLQGGSRSQSVIQVAFPLSAVAASPNL